MSKRKRICDPRKTYLDNIHNRESLPTHVVVSAVQGLFRVADRGDEKYLMPLLDSGDKAIASAALSTLRIHWSEMPHLMDRIVEFASEYPHNDEENILQLSAIRAIEEYAISNDSMVLRLVEIAERYRELPDSFEAHQANAAAWEALANLTGEKITGKDDIELTWNIHGEASEKIRERIRESILVHIDNRCGVT